MAPAMVLLLNINFFGFLSRASRTQALQTPARSRNSHNALRYTAPFLTLCAAQYRSSLRSVSTSVRMLYLISLGRSAFGRPIFFGPSCLIISFAPLAFLPVVWYAVHNQSGTAASTAPRWFPVKALLSC